MSVVRRWNGTTWELVTGAQGATGSTGSAGSTGAAGGPFVATAYSATHTAVSGQLSLDTGTYTVTVPVTGQFAVKNVGTGTITVASASGTIDGQANIKLDTQYASVTLAGDGTNLWIV